MRAAASDVSDVSTILRVLEYAAKIADVPRQVPTNTEAIEERRGASAGGGAGGCRQLLPLLWRRRQGFETFVRAFRLDPATSSAPFVATLVDVTGLVIYFEVTKLILSGSML